MTIELLGSTGRFSLFGDQEHTTVHVRGSDGERWFSLRLLAAADTLAGPDETLGLPELVTRVDSGTITVSAEATSSCWSRRVTTLVACEDRIRLRTSIVGQGRLLRVTLAGGTRAGLGHAPSGSALRSALSPNPDHPSRIVKPASETSIISVCGSGGEPGIGRWIYAPAPWCWAAARSERIDDQQIPEGEWVSIGVRAPIARQTFTTATYRSLPQGFTIELDYEGHTEVDHEFELPELEFSFGHDDPFAAIAAYCAELTHDRLAPAPRPEPPRRALEPIFCGWGQQVADALAAGGPAPDRARAHHYDRWLGILADAGVNPGTIVIDDKWARSYAGCEVDTDKWPDLAGWIARQHHAGRRVLLWWKAWDPEGLAPEATIRLPDGTPVATDPQSASYRALLDTAVRHLLGPEGLNADGFKIDFLASTPSGVNLIRADDLTGDRLWGSALLHELLAVVHCAAKAVKPDSLLITHTPNPAYRDVTDMIRLNDILMLDQPYPMIDVVPHMRMRAAIVRAAVPDLPIDTDGWALPGREAWHEYLTVAPELGVPALYHAESFDLDGSRLSKADLAEVRDVWESYRHQLESRQP